MKCSFAPQIFPIATHISDTTINTVTTTATTTTTTTTTNTYVVDAFFQQEVFFAPHIFSVAMEMSAVLFVFPRLATHPTASKVRNFLPISRIAKNVHFFEVKPRNFFQFYWFWVFYVFVKTQHDWF